MIDHSPRKFLFVLNVSLKIVNLKLIWDFAVSKFRLFLHPLILYSEPLVPVSLSGGRQEILLCHHLKTQTFICVHIILFILARDGYQLGKNEKR